MILNKMKHWIHLSYYSPHFKRMTRSSSWYVARK
jgi:hypothetical protein